MRARAQGPRDERRPGGDEADPVRPRAADREDRRTLLFGWLVGMAIVLMIMAFDILTRAHDQPQQGLALPIIDEASSAVATAVVMLGPAMLALWLRRRAPPWPQALAVYVLGALAYPVLHVAGFVALRKIAYALWLHRAYVFGALPGEFLYEAGKDVPAYLFAAASFRLFLAWRARRPRRLRRRGREPRYSTSATARGWCALRSARSSPCAPPATMPSSCWRTAGGR